MWNRLPAQYSTLFVIEIVKKECKKNNTDIWNCKVSKTYIAQYYEVNKKNHLTKG